MHRQPLIGISGSMNTEENQYHINRDYVRSLTEAGAIPLLLAPDMTDEQARQCAEELDGLLLSGGNDVSPRCFGQEPVQGLGEVNPLRDQSELRLVKLFLEKEKPILGICRGMQALNVFFGGTLHARIPGHQQVQGDLIHPTRARGLLSQLLGPAPLVNSNHHQAVRVLGEELCLLQQAADGTIEGFCQKCLITAAMCRKQGRELTEDDVRTIAKESWPENARGVTIENVQKYVEKVYDVSHEDLVGPKRVKEIMMTRHVAIWLCRELCNRTLADIGKKFGGRSHATIKHSIHTVEELAKDDKVFFDQLQRMKEGITSEA